MSTSDEETTAVQALSAEDRLREISRMWAVEINKGYPFLANSALVPALRSLLDGYDHPDELPSAEVPEKEVERMRRIGYELTDGRLPWRPLEPASTE